MESPIVNVNNEPLPIKKLNRRLVSVMFLLIAVLFAVFGVWEMYSYGESDKIVGGDAYNYTIIAARGTGLICCGIISALIAVTVSIWDLIDRQT
jgi:hypothetical protein